MVGTCFFTAHDHEMDVPLVAPAAEILSRDYWTNCCQLRLTLAGNTESMQLPGCDNVGFKGREIVMNVGTEYTPATLTKFWALRYWYS